MSAKRIVVRLEDPRGRWREVECEGNKVTQRVAPSGDDDGETSTRYDTSKEAREAFDFLLSRYAKTGHRELSRAEPTEAAPGRAHRFVDDAASEQTCRESAGDVRPWRIYADWLVERGDPRGELASLSLSGSQEAAEAFLERHRDALLGGHSENDLYDVALRHGFVHRLALRRPGTPGELRLEALVADVLAHPGARFVEELKVGANAGDRDWSAALRAVLAASQAAWLRALELDTRRPSGGVWSVRADLSDLWSGAPRLEVLRIDTTHSIELGRIAHPTLLSFTHHGEGLDAVEARSLAAAQWPHLRSLSLMLGESPDAAFRAVLDGLPPALKRLGFPGSGLRTNAIGELAGTKELASLSALDLSGCSFGDESVSVWLEWAPRFKHLERLDLSANYFGEGAAELAREFPNAVLSEQRVYEERYDDAGE